MSYKYFITNRGIAVYPKLIKPDTKFDAEGVFKTGLKMSREAAQPLVDLAKECFTDEYGPKKLSTAQMPFKDVEGEEDSVEVSLKTKERPKFFDRRGSPIKNVDALKLGGGSTLKIKGAMKAYTSGGKMGVSLYINEVQIIDLKEFGGSSFTEEEGSFDADDDTPSTGRSEPPAFDDASDEDINF